MYKSYDIDLSDYVPFEHVSNEDLLKATLFNRCRMSDTGCWLWLGHRDRAGYGRVRLNGKVRGAHVLSHTIFKGPVTKGLIVLHSCDTPACVNPAHLRAGTHQENIDDCISRGRFRTHKGSANSLAKLTDEDVVDIRNSTMSIKAISRKYGIDRTNVHFILSGKTWSHVSMPEVPVERTNERAKLTRVQVSVIKSADASITHRKLASQYGVGVPLISMIRNGRIWKSVAASSVENI